MASSARPVVKVEGNKTKKRAPRKCAPSSHVVDPGVAIGSPDDEYVPCSNQNGEVQSPVWMFFRLRKSDLEKAQPGPRQCYCKVAGCGAVCNRSVSGSTKALSVHLEDEHGWSFESCKAAVADARAEGTILEPRNRPDVTAQRSGVKRKE